MNRFRIRELVRKEWIQLFRDKRNRALMVVVPLIQLLIFGYVVNFDVRQIRLALLDQSSSKESLQVREAFTANGLFTIDHVVTDPEAMEKLLLRGKIDAGIKIGPEFSRKIHRGETAPIQILVDGTVSNMASIRVSYIITILERLNRTMMRDIHPLSLNISRIDLRLRTWYNPNLYSQHFFVPGIVAFVIMLVTLLSTSMAIIKEKERGTIEQLIVTPLKPYEFILGKTIPYTVVALIQMMVITLIAVFWFDLPFHGSVTLYFFAICLFLLSTLGIGLFISTISKTQQQAMMATFFYIQPAFLLSGFVFPIANMPAVIQGLTYLNPFRYILVIIRGIFLKGVGWDILWPQYAALFILGVLVFGSAIARFRKRLD